jgi:hypothetical protein
MRKNNTREENSMHEEKKHGRGATCKARRKEILTMIGLGF